MTRTSSDVREPLRGRSLELLEAGLSRPPAAAGCGPSGTIECVSRLRRRLVWAAGDVTLADVSCDCHRSSWSADEYGSSFALVFVRRGCFFRRANGVESLVDSSVVYFERPGDEYQVAHPERRRRRLHALEVDGGTRRVLVR
jgi:hypothetical protein